MPEKNQPRPNQQPQQPSKPQQPPSQPSKPPQGPHIGTGTRHDSVEPSVPWPRK